MAPQFQQHPTPPHHAGSSAGKVKKCWLVGRGYEEARVRAELDPKSPGVILPGSLKRCRQDLLSVLMEAGHRAPSLYLETPGSYWPGWLLGDRSYPVWAQGAHSLGWSILISFRLTHQTNKSEQPFTVCQVISDSIFQGVVIPTQGGITIPVYRGGN